MVRLVTVENNGSTPGNRIKALREKHKLSQGALARMLKISRPAVSKWEANSVIPDGKNLVSCARILQTTPEFILNGLQPTKDHRESSQLSLDKIDQVEYILLPLVNESDIEMILKQKFTPSAVKKVPVILDEIDLNVDRAIIFEVKGDAMVSYEDPSKSLIEGELAIIDRSKKPTSGSLVIARISENDYKIRELKQDGSEFHLKSYNKDYKAIKLDNLDQVIGVIVSTMRNKIF
jgi:SOS-response transcriptional repressor LexA